MNRLRLLLFLSPLLAVHHFSPCHALLPHPLSSSRRRRVSWTRQDHKHWTRSSSSSSSLQMTTTTLNEDGDFLIPGLNDDVQSIPKQAPMSLLDLSLSDEATLSTTSSSSSPFPSTTTTSSTSSSTISTSGSDEPQDHFGRKLHQELQQLRGEGPFSFSSSSFTTPTNQYDNPPTTTQSDPRMGAPTNPPPEDDKSSSHSLPIMQQQQPQQHHDNPQHLAALQEFVQMILPNLANRSQLAYAQGLDDLGFDPDCESSRQLQLDDLGFMKPLHQRFFWAEWQSLVMEEEDDGDKE